jgi:hypothetical protein
VSGFSVEWLALREPHDAAARAADLVPLLKSSARGGYARGALTRAGAAPERADSSTARTIVDLGAGSGANLRWLAPRLGGAQDWLLVDHDAALLAAVESELDRWAKSYGADLAVRGAQLGVRGATFECRVQRATLDLATGLARLPIPEGALVTSCALLDLVSAEWLDELARRCRAASAEVCFALSYDGRGACDPAEPEDAEVLELFNRHQRGDKGFGPALGPAAPGHASETLERLDYRVTARHSDWRLGPGAGDIQRALLDGWLEASAEVAPQRRAALEAWHRRRVAHVDAGRSTLVVGHVDLVGMLTDTLGAASSLDGRG